MIRAEGNAVSDRTSNSFRKLCRKPMGLAELPSSISFQGSRGLDSYALYETIREVSLSRSNGGIKRTHGVSNDTV